MPKTASMSEHRGNLKTSTASSSRMTVTHGVRTASGRLKRQSKTLTPAQIADMKREEEARIARRISALREQQRQSDLASRDVPDASGNDDAWADEYVDDIMRGRTAAEISHAGENLSEDAAAEASQSLLEELRAHHRLLFARPRDNRKRTNRTQIRVDAYSMQMDAMADAYTLWALSTAEEGMGKLYTQPEDAIVETTHRIYVVDLFSAFYQEVRIIQGDRNVASAYVRQGLVPTAPHLPNVAITIRALEIFRAAQLRCPHLSLQSFVRALCDIHAVPPRGHLTAQFSIAFDVYLAICAEVDRRMQVALGRDTPNWRLKNACPACLYKLEGEEAIPLPFLATFDGNNSLKRFWRREREVVQADGRAIPGASKEQRDNRTAPGDYYIPRAEVDKWAKEGVEELIKGFVPGSGEADEGGGCDERWQNMKDDVTARAYGMYDETGFFPCLCRHSFVLVVVDMVKSGELAKYGFAITAHLLRVLGELGVGYDIGCKFGKMVRMHPALSSLAADSNFKALVGAFHGHAHNRRCQLKNLSTYVKGMGLEDLEECESFFFEVQRLSLNNTLRHGFPPTAGHHDLPQARRCRRRVPGGSVRTAPFYTPRLANPTPVALLLASKYRRALKIKATEPLLRETMANLGVESRSVFELWLEEEKKYLESLSKEPVHETLQMEYYQKLVNLADHQKRLDEMQGMGLPYVFDSVSSYAGEAAETRRLETQRRHALEVLSRTLAAVQDLEIRLGVVKRWEPEDAEWIAAATMVVNRRYQRALDELEGLVVARMFELSKAHMSDTGYKLRKHIAKALQARSKGVRTALDRYNDAAAALSPPRTQLTWEQIVEYAFLADFDLLREGRQDIRSEPWAQPAGRLAMDRHFKLLRADEEIARVNLEIQRFVTYMVDEERFLVYHEERLRAEGNPGLAHQVGVHRMERSRFNALHMENLVKLSKEDGFTGSISPGVRVSKERRVPEVRASSTDGDHPMPTPLAPHVPTPPLPPEERDGEEEEEEEEEAEAEVDGEALADAFEAIVRLTNNQPAAQAS
ncbi:hypothetical protein MSAN_01764300 [Mycena sanguinolenta]|uniref:CxC1-like cysteine cluster associated with KDZ transposases domain-containing protein n=1 Tax=Mycena sanguinolenta TaxID=230812 RepID=A0A8H7CTX7_9AGAR|nr:hypothetical protein MSAN_01764300 [Mycena sanguinolenta]